MKDPPPFPRAHAGLGHAFADLSAVERWAARAQAGGRPEPYIAREALNGPQFSITTHTTDGMHDVVAITARPTRRTAPTGRPSPISGHGDRGNDPTDPVDPLRSVDPLTPWEPQEPTRPAAPAGRAGTADQAVLRSLVRSLLDLAGHEHGPAHTEVVLTPSGPRILECRLESPTHL
jgi:hypothetical protein